MKRKFTTIKSKTYSIFIQHLFKTPQLAVWVWWFLFLRGFNTPQKKGAGFIRKVYMVNPTTPRLRGARGGEK